MIKFKNMPFYNESEAKIHETMDHIAVEVYEGLHGRDYAEIPIYMSGILTMYPDGYNVMLRMPVNEAETNVFGLFPSLQCQIKLANLLPGESIINQHYIISNVEENEITQYDTEDIYEYANCDIDEDYYESAVQICKDELQRVAIFVDDVNSYYTFEKAMFGSSPNTIFNRISKNKPPYMEGGG